MRSAVALIFAAGALAIPHKRDVITHYDVVYETDVVTVWADAVPSSSVAVAPAAASPTPASSPAPAVGHYGHNHWTQQGGWSRSQSPAPESSTPSSTYEAPTTTSTSAPPPPPPPPAPTTTSTSTPPPPPPPTSYLAPSSSSVWVAPSSAPAPAPAPAPASSADLPKPSGYQELVVYHHNIHRRNHSSPDLDWSDDLAASAQAVASSCKYAHNVDANGGGYGQNIAAGVEPANISAIITDLFYNGEVNWYEGLYNQAQPDMSNFEKWGHFSQIVWKDTTHVGCATQHCTGPKGLENVGKDVVPYFTVCNYKNPGNFANEYGKNVGVSLKHKTAEWNDGM